MTAKLVKPSDGLRVGVDIGGTFTDCVVIDQVGRRLISKALTTHHDLVQGVLEALALNAAELGVSRAEMLAATSLFVHGTTVGTNALLTRSGARTGLITTRGHEDALTIGKVFAKRAGLSEREIAHSSRLAKPEPIVPRELIRGVTERIDRDGEVLLDLDEDDARRAIDELVAAGVEAIAVALLWSFANERHERRIAELLAERAPEAFVTVSHDLVPLLGEYERTATCALNAYIGPKVVGYLTTLERTLRTDGLAQPLFVMQTGGGLTSVEDAVRRPILTLDSGPVGGILGGRYLGDLYNEPNVICSDVGGTSFEVGVILGGEVPLDPEPVVSQYTLRIPKVAVRSIGAGGGTIAWLDDTGLLRVGPLSAGSDPGPACYGRGGTRPTVTDADLVLGYLDPDCFLAGRITLDRDAALRALDSLGRRLDLEPEAVALGVFRIINAQMADLMHRSTIENGYDPRDCVLLAYGGAGPTHAAFYGSDVGVRSIVIPSTSAVFSAEGLLTCDLAHAEHVSRTMVEPLDGQAFGVLDDLYGRLERRVLARFADEGIPADRVALSRTIGVRYALQVHSLELDFSSGPTSAHTLERLGEDFAARYVALFGEGALPERRTLELNRYGVTGVHAVERPAAQTTAAAATEVSEAQIGTRRAHFEPDGFQPAPVFDGRMLRFGHRILGPALVQRMGDSVVVPEGTRAVVDERLTLHLERTSVTAEEAFIPNSEVPR